MHSSEMLHPAQTGPVFINNSHNLSAQFLRQLERTMLTSRAGGFDRNAIELAPQSASSQSSPELVFKCRDIKVHSFVNRSFFCCSTTRSTVQPFKCPDWCFRRRTVQSDDKDTFFFGRPALQCHHHHISIGGGSHLRNNIRLTTRHDSVKRSTRRVT